MKIRLRLAGSSHLGVMEILITELQIKHLLKKVLDLSAPQTGRPRYFRDILHRNIFWMKQPGARSCHSEWFWSCRNCRLHLIRVYNDHINIECSRGIQYFNRCALVRGRSNKKAASNELYNAANQEILQKHPTSKSTWEFGLEAARPDRPGYSRYPARNIVSYWISKLSL